MKKVISLILCLLMLGSCFAYADTIEGSRTVIGADLDEEDIAFVYKQFGIDRGDVKELSVTNAEERELLLCGCLINHYAKEGAAKNG